MSATIKLRPVLCSVVTGVRVQGRGDEECDQANTLGVPTEASFQHEVTG